MSSRLDVALLALTCISAAAFAYTSDYGQSDAACDPEPDEDVDIHFESLEGPIAGSDAVDPSRKAKSRSVASSTSNRDADVEPLASELEPMDCRIERDDGETSLSFYCYARDRDRKFHVHAKLERR
jgi:hypothetical protein